MSIVIISRVTTLYDAIWCWRLFFVIVIIIYIWIVDTYLVYKIRLNNFINFMIFKIIFWNFCRKLKKKPWKTTVCSTPLMKSIERKTLGKNMKRMIINSCFLNPSRQKSLQSSFSRLIDCKRFFRCFFFVSFSTIFHWFFFFFS